MWYCKNLYKWREKIILPILSPGTILQYSLVGRKMLFALVGLVSLVLVRWVWWVWLVFWSYGRIIQELRCVEVLFCFPHLGECLSNSSCFLLAHLQPHQAKNKQK